MSSVPRSMEATDARAVASVEAQRLAYPNGWWGMAMLVATELTLFGVFFGTYFYLRFNSVHWPPRGTPEPELLIPLIMASVLITTSIPMQIASRAARRGRLNLTRAALGLALFVQSGYWAFEIHDLTKQLHEFSPQDNAYSSIYYVLLGADHVHVWVGLVLNVWILWKLVGGLTNYRLIGLRAIVFYWHFVNILTFAVVGALVSPRV